VRIAVWHYLPFGGAKRALHLHLKGLHARGHELVIFQPPLSRDELDLSSFGEVHTVPLDFVEKPGLVGSMTRIRRLIRDFNVHAARAAAEIDKSGCDVLFANNALHVNTPWVGKYVRTMPKVMYLQDPYRPLYEPMPELPIVAVPKSASLKRRIRDQILHPQYRQLALVELEAVRSYDQVLCNSYFSREALLRAFGISAEVCYLGIDTDRFQPSKNSPENFIFGLGTCGPMKGVREAILAVAELPAPRPPLIWSANLVDEIYRAEVEALAKQVGVEFRLERMLPDDAVIDLMHRAGVLIYTSRLEPFGLVPLEANACGLPVVAIAEGGVRETVRDGVNGLICDPEPKALARGMNKLLTDLNFRITLGKSSREYVLSAWTSEAAIDRVEEKLRHAMLRNQV
jgi:glycosyltransferase involved in cell wall biosynthesis